MKLLSLKTRILLGAILWTSGLFTIAIVLLHVVLPHPPAHGLSHWMFRYGPAMALAAALCMLFGVLQVRRGVSPINQLRNRLMAVHKGDAAHVGGSYPAEVQPQAHTIPVTMAQYGFHRGLYSPDLPIWEKRSASFSCNEGDFGAAP